MAGFSPGDHVRSKTSLVTGLVTERIVIEQGHEILPPLFAGTEYAHAGAWEERVDLRVEYTDDHGNQAEALIHEADAEAA